MEQMPRVFFQVLRGAASFFALHLTLGGKVGICGRDNLFFALHLILEGRGDLQRICPPLAN